MINTKEIEILAGSRAFPQAQIEFAGTPVNLYLPNPMPCSWYGTEVDPNRGCFAMVSESEPQLAEQLVGEFLRVSYRGRAVHVYCIGSTPEIETPLALSRRAFLALDILPRNRILVFPEVLQ